MRRPCGRGTSEIVVGLEKKVSKKLLLDLGELEKAIEKNEFDAVQRS